MTRRHSKSYHYPRWPLVKHTAACALWLLAGAGIVAAPIGHARWLGLLPIAHCGFQWHFRLQPKWSYIVHMDHEKLQVGATAYLWDSFDHFQIERSGDSKRCIHLIGRNGLLDIEIKDDLPGFDELAHTCFFHVNQKQRGGSAEIGSAERKKV